VTEIKRRGFLGSAVLGGVAMGVGASPAALAEPAHAEHVPPFDPATITASDSRYPSLLRGTNHRFIGSPDYIRVVSSTDQVVAAVNEAVAANRRIAVRSGGHCFEDFTASPDIKVLLDMSEMTAVAFDPRLRAFSVQPGATLGHLYRLLFKGWGVTVPAGMCAEVGVGGHFAGGGYGALSRSLGSVADYVCAVEVVVVDRSGRAHAVLATNDPHDPHRDLWWAHTGGGGGNFGVVTRYWLRSPRPSSNEPTGLLPKAPDTRRTAFINWGWDRLTQPAFVRILRNFFTWFERNSAADSPCAQLFPFCQVTGRVGLGLLAGVIIDGGDDRVEALTTEFLDAVSTGAGIDPVAFPRDSKPWLYAASFPGFGDSGTIDMRRFKIKTGYLRKGYQDGQIDAIYRHFSTEADIQVQLFLNGYGGRVNTVAPHATATAQRDSIVKAVYLTPWASEADDEKNIRQLRELFRDVYADTGGVPVPNDVSDGSYINYPDPDLADPAWNTSGVPWHTMYYKDNYPRLQQIKKRYDPRNVFRHALSIQLPA
jgi:hypothetical protein